MFAHARRVFNEHGTFARYESEKAKPFALTQETIRCRYLAGVGKYGPRSNAEETVSRVTTHARTIEHRCSAAVCGGEQQLVRTASDGCIEFVPVYLPAMLAPPCHAVLRNAMRCNVMLCSLKELNFICRYNAQRIYISGPDLISPTGPANPGIPLVFFLFFQ